eukprot:5567705-Amphidinium_carterae.1
MRQRSFYTHRAGEDGSSPKPAQSLKLPTGVGIAEPDFADSWADQEVGVLSGVEDAGTNLDVRVDDSMDRSVPVVAGDPEVSGSTYRVGPHSCQLTAGDTRMTCKKCG